MAGKKSVTKIVLHEQEPGLAQQQALKGQRHYSCFLPSLKQVSYNLKCACSQKMRRLLGEEAIPIAAAYPALKCSDRVPSVSWCGVEGSKL